MRDLIESLNRAHELDEATNTDALSKLTRAAENAKLYMNSSFIEYALEDDGAHVDEVIENEITPVGDAVKQMFPNVAHWRHADNDKFNAIQVYTRPKNSSRFGHQNYEGFFEYSRGILHDITTEVEASNSNRASDLDESADVYDALTRAQDLDEAAFSGDVAGDNSASGGTVRGRGASVQPSKTNYLNRMKSKNPDLVDTMVIQVSDIKPGMITQAGQVKEAEARNHPSGGKKMYIMHTNGYDGFWGLDETMDVMVDPENKSKPFAGDYKALLKMGLQEGLRLAEDYDFKDNWAHSIFTDDVNGELIHKLGSRLHDDCGVPVRCEYSQWNYGGLVGNLFDTLPVVLTEDNLESIVDKICSAYATWKENAKCDAPDDSGNDWYNDTGAADDDGWPDSAMSDDPDYCSRVDDWWYSNRWQYEDDEEDDYDDDYDDDDEDVDESLDSEQDSDKSTLLKEDIQLPSNVHAYNLGMISANGIEYLDFLGKDGPEYEFTLEDYYYQPTNLGKRLVMIIKIDDGDEYLVVMDDGRVMDILYQGSGKWATYIFDTMKECLNDLHNVDGFISAISNSESAVRELEQQIAMNEVSDIAEYMVDGIQRYPEDWRQNNDRASVVDSILDELKDKKYGYFKDYDFDLTDETLNTVANKVCDLIMPTIEAL